MKQMELRHANLLLKIHLKSKRNDFCEKPQYLKQLTQSVQQVIRRQWQLKPQLKSS